MNDAIEIANGMQVFAKYKCDFYVKSLMGFDNYDHICVVCFEKISDVDIQILVDNNWQGSTDEWYYELGK